MNRAQPDQPKWLELASHYTRAATDRFALDAGGYYDTLADQPDLFVRVRGTYDGAIPSANGRMIHNLLDLYELTGEPGWLDRALRDLRSFTDPLERSGAGMVQMQGALLRALEIAPDRIADKAPPPRSVTGVEPSAEPLTASIETGTITFVDGVATFAVTLDIGAGYHINSHQPSEAMLIPTELTLVGADGYEFAVQYPEPDMAEYVYADRPLSVFQGHVLFNTTLRRKPTAAGPLPTDAALLLRYQACTDTACLPPATVRLPLSVEAD
ncbi:MAG: protein-disulfide reductase DsbD family protein [Phycisphaerales bacterium]